MNKVIGWLRFALYVTVFAPFTTFLMVASYLSGRTVHEDFMYFMVFVSTVWFVLLLMFLGGV